MPDESKRGRRCYSFIYVSHFLFKFNPKKVHFWSKRTKWNRNLHNINPLPNGNPNNNRPMHLFDCALYVLLVRPFFYVSDAQSVLVYRGDAIGSEFK